jgi:hypothetical protein
MTALAVAKQYPDNAATELLRRAAPP